MVLPTILWILPLKANFLWLKYSTLEWRKKWDPLYLTSLDFTILHSICKQVFIFIFNMYNWEGCKNSDCRITPVFFINTLTSVCTFSILHSIHFLRCWQGEVLKQSRASLVCDHFLYSLNLNEGFSGGIVLPWASHPKGVKRFTISPNYWKTLFSEFSVPQKRMSKHSEDHQDHLVLCSWTSYILRKSRNTSMDWEGQWAAPQLEQAETLHHVHRKWFIGLVLSM